MTLHPDWRVPSARILHKYFRREGLVKKPRRSRRRPHPGRPTAPFDAPNSIWSADFKGHFKTLDGRYCYPLTVQDGFSRYLLACQGLDGTTHTLDHVPSSLVSSTSSGCPTESAPTTAHPSLPWPSAVSPVSPSGGSVSVSCPTSSNPASPQQNGRHERMHKDLKADTTIPPAANRSAQQRRFNSFRSDFNEIRPHEAHNQQPPASIYVPSTRPFPNKLQVHEYPAHYETRKVSSNGGFRWLSTWVNLSHLLGGEYIGLEEIADDVWTVYFGPVSLGWLHVQKGAILDRGGSSPRNPKL